MAFLQLPEVAQNRGESQASGCELGREITAGADHPSV